MDLIEKLNLLGKAVHKNSPNINFGGCCVFAAAVALELEKHGVKARGIIASHNATYHEIPLGRIRPKVKNNSIYEWRDNGVYFGHVGVEFTYRGKLYHYDTEGVHPKAATLDNTPIYKGRMKPEEMDAIASSPEGWNTTFPRRQIPSVKRLIKEHLKDVTAVA